jgi:hypothetical protein
MLLAAAWCRFETFDSEILLENIMSETLDPVESVEIDVQYSLYLRDQESEATRPWNSVV